MTDTVLAENIVVLPYGSNMQKYKFTYSCPNCHTTHKGVEISDRSFQTTGYQLKCGFVKIRFLR